MIPASASEFPVFNFKKASLTMLISLELFSNSPVIVKLPVTVTSPVNPIAPVAPVKDNGVLVTPPSLIVKLKSLSCEVCAIVTLLLVTVIDNSCASPTTNPPSESIVSDPVVVSAASALKKLPPAISDADEFEVELTSMKVACVFVPSNTAPSVELSDRPALISANPV